jgi:hypothetical protein
MRWKGGKEGGRMDDGKEGRKIKQKMWLSWLMVQLNSFPFVAGKFLVR